MTMRCLLLLVVALASGGRADAQRCRADFDASGAVEVNEIIQVVNEALAGCGGPAATPTRRVATPTRTPTPVVSCPFRFDDTVDSNRFCGYVGNADSACGAPFAVASSWITDGGDVIALLVSAVDSIGVLARRTSPTAAAISGFAFGPDFDQFFTTTGTLSLPTDRQFRLSMRASAECGTLSHTGAFDSLLGEGARGATAGDDAGLSAAMHGEPAAAVAADGLVTTWRTLLRELSPPAHAGRSDPQG